MVRKPEATCRFCVFIGLFFVKEVGKVVKNPIFYNPKISVLTKGKRISILKKYQIIRYLKILQNHVKQLFFQHQENRMADKITVIKKVKWVYILTKVSILPDKFYYVKLNFGFL